MIKIWYYQYIINKKIINIIKNEQMMRNMNEKKKINDYVLKMREDKLSYQEAVKKILQENNIKSLPIPVIDIAKSFGFNIYSVNFKDDRVAGIMADSDTPLKAFENNKRIIAINAKDYLERKYFTIAHEIGHFVLHCNKEQNFFERYMHGLDRNQREDVENAANAFAAELLMPAQMFIDFIKNNSGLTRNELIEEIRRTFIVSPKAIERRLDELKINILG